MISEHDRQLLSRLPVWNPTGDVVAQRRAWEELATVYNQDLPAIGDLEQNVELRSGLRADVAVPKGAARHPVVIYLHGGGWAFGSPTSHRKLGMQFAEAGTSERVHPPLPAPDGQLRGQCSGSIAQCLNLEREFHHTASKLCIFGFEPLKQSLIARVPPTRPHCFSIPH